MIHSLLPEIVLAVGALMTLAVAVLLPVRSTWVAGLALFVLAATSATLLSIADVTILFKLLVLGVAAMIVLISVGPLEIAASDSDKYYGLLLCAALGTMVMAGTTRVASAVGGFAVMSIALYYAGAPLRQWTPEGHVRVPAPIVAFLSTGSLVGAFAAILRLVCEGLPLAPSHWRLAFQLLAALMMTVGSVVALTQSSVTRLLTSSSIAQAGYVMAALAAGSARGATAAVITLLVYVVAQSGAFAVLAVLRRHDLPGDALKDLRGLWGRQPIVAGAMLIFMLALGGLAPTAGFIGKLAVLGAAVDAHAALLAVVVVLSTTLSLASYLRVVVFMSGDGAGLPGVTVSPVLAVAIGTATLILLWLGAFPQWLFVAPDTSVHTLVAPRLSAFFQRW